MERAKGRQRKEPQVTVTLERESCYMLELERACRACQEDPTLHQNVVV